ncbi:hypothetical protein BKA70DRAFT_33988 [Coprinopsis sp. MPI-PUGE-AT-0042]|nr:hypothetical protein BKA70DRAFT_33988 [Coprinopsis sp. MPI-PUGE-AT-0042]
MSTTTTLGAKSQTSMVVQAQPHQNHMPRRNSLRLPIQPPEVPVPPSLVGSPYLRSGRYHQAQRGPVSPHYPSEEDELWLQDTVPIGSPGPSFTQPASSSPPSSSSNFPSSPSSSSSSSGRPAQGHHRSHQSMSSVSGSRGGGGGRDSDRLVKTPPSERGSPMHIVEAGLLATATFDFGLPASLSPGSRQAWRRTAAGYTVRTTQTCPSPLHLGGSMISPPSHYFADMNSVR